jgi:hypothetical protein
MHRPRALIALTTIALALLAAAPAAAKEAHLRSVRACGLTGCVRLTDRHVLRVVERDAWGPGRGESRFGPYYRLRLQPSLNQPQLDYYLPLARRIQLNGVSMRVGSATAARLRAELGPQQPIPPRLMAVTVGGRRAADPRPYLGMLYGTPVRPPATAWNRPDVLIGLSFAGGRQTPWADWGEAEYFPSTHLLHVPDGTWVHLGSGQAATIAADLDGHPTATGGGTDWATVAAVLAAVAAAAAVLAVRLRPRRRERVA